MHTDEIPDPYFFLPWDASHWLDLAMVELREESGASDLLKRLIYDLCGVLDIKPAFTLIIKCQALSFVPWKIVTWFPRMIKTKKRMEKHLCEVRDGIIGAPNKDLC